MKVDSREDLNIPPFGYVIDYMTYGGIYRDVWLYCLRQVFVERALIRYDLENKNAVLKPELFLDNSGPECSLDSGYLPEGQRGRRCGFLQKMHPGCPGQKQHYLRATMRPVPHSVGSGHPLPLHGGYNP